MKITPLINIDEFSKLDGSKIVLVDAGSGDSAYENYLRGHLHGALYVDLNKDLADISGDAKEGGRHPLPTVRQFKETLKRLGIEKNSHVIIYDDKHGANAAARFWWMLRGAGLQKVQVLNGGLQAAKEKGLLVNSQETQSEAGDPFSFPTWELPLADLSFIEENAGNSDYLVIDVREKDRYEGKTEPIDEIAGHIPGAINIPFKENLNEDGTFKSPEILHRKYAEIFQNIPSHKIAVHCGSGVTACHTLLALDHAGFEIPKLYVGSWSEWSRNKKPVATKD